LKLSIDTSLANKLFKKAKLTCNLSLKGTADSEFNFFAKNNKLYLQTINDYCQQIINTKIDVEDDFETFSCEANLTSDFANIYTSDKLNLVYSADKNVVHLGDKSAKCVVLANDGSDFIPFNFLPKSIIFDVPGSSLWHALNYTAFSTSKESMINAVYLNFDSAYLTAYSFDDRRMSRFRVKIGDNCPEFESFFVPKETAEILINLLQDSTVTFQVGHRHLKLSWKDTTLILSLVQIDKKSYPDLNKFFRKDDTASFSVNKSEMMKALKLSGLVAKNSFINIELKDSKLIFTGSDKERGSTQNKIDCISSENNGEVQVLHKDLMDCISKVEDEELTFKIKQIDDDKLSLCLICGNFNHLLMPIVSKEENEED
jgi:DNA polymerase III sliding clamp (beta) subunit (PCNA family)